MPKFTVVRTTREYETIFILRPDIQDDDKKKVFDRIQGVIDKLDGFMIKREEWGKRKLAYPIQKFTHGIYYYYQYLGYGNLVGELERNLRLLEPVLKYMTVKLADDVDREARILELSHPEPEEEHTEEQTGEVETQAPEAPETTPEQG